MANTFTKIASVTVGSGGTSTIDFTSIPSTYSDLCLYISARSSTSATRCPFTISINSSTASQTYIRTYLEDGTFGSDTGSASTVVYMTADTATADTFGSAYIYIPNYAGSNNKSFGSDSVAENASTTKYDMFMIAGLRTNTAAITSISLYPYDSSTIKQYSTAYLYGIKNS